MGLSPVIRNCSYYLIHAPDLVRYGSKPRREIAKNPDLAETLTGALRSYGQAISYPANQTFIGNLTPDQLATLPRPWFNTPAEPDPSAKRLGKFGEILDQEIFYGLLKLADALSPPLFETSREVLGKLQQRLASHPLFREQAALLEPGDSDELPDPEAGALPLTHAGRTYGFFHGDQRAEARDDENLLAPDLLENLCTKASGALAIKGLLAREAMDPQEIDFVISCGEEACGDRYQRGGGGMAKTMAEMSGCENASGMDIKNFCAAPASAIVTAAALVQSGVFKKVVVAGGGSLAKLGMKFQAFLEHDIPILDDCLAAAAFLITNDDATSPIIRLDPGAVGTVPVGAATADESVFRHYLLKPLENLGLKCTDIDRYATELQNPEIMEFAGSGDVTKKNYRKIAAMAVMAGQLTKGEMKEWINQVGMIGFAPTQGHIPSAIPFIGHAMEAMARQEINRVMFLSRASLFLNRCTNLLDGVSFIMERNPGNK